MSKDIENILRSCDICREHQWKNTKGTMIIKEHVTRPFQNITADIFWFNSLQFLLVADRYRKMPFIKTMKTVTCINCIEYFKAIFAVHGIPEHLYTDNARYSVSNEFHNFTTKWEFMNITPNQRYPQSNGFIERMVQTVKNWLPNGSPLDSHLLSPT